MKEQQDKVADFWRREFDFGVFRGIGGVRLQYARRAVAGQTALIVVSGRTEFMEKYAEVFHDLRDLGVSLYIYDHRGQGASERLLADSQKGHVESFADYVGDLELFIDTIVRADRPRKIMLLSHSMGGTISMLYAMKHQDLLNSLILSSPMFSITTRPIPGFLARIICRTAVLLGREKGYVFGTGPYKPDPPKLATAPHPDRRHEVLSTAGQEIRAIIPPLPSPSCILIHFFKNAPWLMAGLCQKDTDLLQDRRSPPVLFHQQFMPPAGNGNPPTIL